MGRGDLKRGESENSEGGNPQIQGGEKYLSTQEEKRKGRGRNEQK